MRQLSPPSQQGYLIGQAASQSGVSSANIRFYESKGLIERKGQGDAGYRLYNEKDIHQLKFIRQLRKLGMGLNEVKVLLHLDLGNKNDCQTARNTLDHHLFDLRQSIREMKVLEEKLSDILSRCDGTHSQCRLLETLHSNVESKK
jgi:DNA-binding transcriptional MerR regulator